MPAITAPLAHSAIIRERLPSWLNHTTAADTDALRQHLALSHAPSGAEAHWLANALPEHRQAVDAARSRYRRSSQVLARTLSSFKGVLAFAEPLLQARLQAELGEAPDVHTTDLVQFHEEALLWALSYRTGYQRQSLLQAALQNFGSDVAFIAKSAVTLKGDFHLDLSDKGLTYRYTRHALQPMVFARLCRELDLGGRYQQHLQTVFETPASRDKVRNDAIDARRDQLRLHASMARARGRIDAAASSAVLRLLDPQHGASPAAPPARPNRLSINGVELHDILLFTLAPSPSGEPSAWLLHLPGELDEALTGHASMAALERHLKARLSEPSFRERLRRYVPLAQQQHLFAVLKRNLAPQALYDDGPWHPDEQVSLYLRLTALDGDLFGVLQDRHVQRLKDDARVLVVPTAEADEQVRKARLAYWQTSALNVLNLAAMFVPLLGPVMLAVTAVQLVNDVYEGIEDWRDGDVDGAMAHLQTVAINAAMMVGTAVALKAAPTLLDALVEVRLPDGTPRLYKPQLEPYRLDAAPADNLAPNAQGQHLHAGRHYIHLGADLYEQGYDAQQQQWRLRHPSRPDAYQPPLQHNGQGTWRSVHEQPLTWSRVTLLRRIGVLVDGLSDTELDQACQVSGTGEDELRRLHADSLPLPPLLADTLQRLKIERMLHRQVMSAAARKVRFTQHYQALVTPDAQVNALCERFKRLTPALARGLVDTLGAARLTRWVPPAAIPAKLLDAAAALATQVPLARAREGLFWPALASPESTRLALLCLEHAPQWSDTVPLEARSGGPQGPLLQRLGRAGPVPRRVLVHAADGYQVYLDGTPLKAPDSDLFGAIHDAIGPRYRAALGLESADAVQQRILSMLTRTPHQLSTWLWSGESRGWATEGRLLGGSGRPGYRAVTPAASALEARYRNLYPHASAAQAQAALREWETGETSAHEQLRTLEQSLQRMKSALTLWAMPSAAREAAREEVLAAWQRSSVRETPEGQTIVQLNLDFLDLNDADLESFPVLQANFDHVHELSLEQNSLTHLPNAFMRHFGQLQRVSLNGCELTEVPIDLGPQVRVLDLANNRLAWSDAAQAALNGYPQLSALSLSNNPLVTAPDVASLTQLQGIDLHNCQLTAFPAHLDQLDAPHLVDLASNQLQHLPSDITPALGRALRLEGNPLDADAQQAIEQFFTTHRVDLLIAEIDYNELLDEATEAQKACWQHLHEVLPVAFFRDLRLLFDSPPYAVAPVTYRRRLWRLLAWMDADTLLRQQIIEQAGGTLLELEQQAEIAHALATPDLPTRSRRLLATIVNHVRLRKIAYGVLSLSFGMSEDSYATLHQWALKRIASAPGIDLAQAPVAGEPVIIDALVDVTPLPSEAWVEQQRSQVLAVDPTTAHGLDEVLAVNHEEEPVYPAWDHHLRDRFAGQFAASRAVLDDALEHAGTTLSEGALLVEAERLRTLYEQRLTDMRRTLTEGVARGTLD